MLGVHHHSVRGEVVLEHHGEGVLEHLVAQPSGYVDYFQTFRQKSDVWWCGATLFDRGSPRCC